MSSVAVILGHEGIVLELRKRHDVEGDDSVSVAGGSDSSMWRSV